MAASGYTPILIYASGTATNVPLAANLTSSASGAELALNYADGKLYYKNSSGVVTLLSASGGGPAGGSNTQVQFNSSGVLAGSSLFTWDGTTLVTPSHTTSTATTGSTNKGPLNYGTLSFSDTGIVQSAQTSVNSYFQNVIQNTSAGTAASAEFIAYNDQGTASTNYATVGINSSGYTGTGSINAPGYAYFLSASTDLVLGTIGANGIHFTTNSSATDALAISSSGAVSLPGGTANGVAYLNGSKVLTTGSALVFDGTNLGVGTNGPQAHLDVSGSGTQYLRASSSTNTAFRGFEFGYVGSGTSYGGLAMELNGGELRLTSGYSGFGGFTTFYTNGSERARIDSSGNLGIGTSSPAYKLDVTGTIQSTTDIRVKKTGSDTVASGPFFYLNSGDGSNNGNIIQLNASNGLDIWNSVGGSYTKKLTLDTSGNLGLGVTPSAWSTPALQFKNASLNSLTGQDLRLYQNLYYNGANYIYQTSNPASLMLQYQNSFAWYLAASGTAGTTATLTQAMTLDASANWFLGTTSSFGARATIASANTVTDSVGQVFVYTTDTQATDVGGKLTLGGQYNSTSGYSYSFGGIAGKKENSTSGNVAGYLQFLTCTSGGALTERARIDSSGNLLVGATTVPTAGQGGTSIGLNSGNGLIRISANGTGTTGLVNFNNPNGNVGYIATTGSVTAYVTASDKRLKENIVDAPEFGSIIDSIQVRSYNWKIDGEHQRAGFIAQELVAVAPEAVHQPANPEEMMGVDYSKLVPMLVKEIQDLRKRLAALEAK